MRADEVVQEREVGGCGGCFADVGPDEGVLLWRGVAVGVGVSGRAVGFAKNSVVGVDDGLHLCGRGGVGTVHRCAVERFVDGGQVTGVDAAHTGCGVLRGVGAGGAGGVVFGSSTDGGHGLVVATDSLVDEGFEFGLRGNRRAIGVGRSQGGQHGGQVVRSDDAGATGSASMRERVDLRISGRSLALGTGVGHGGSGGVGQALQLGDAVDRVSCFGVNHVAQQSLRGVGHAGYAYGGVVIDAGGGVCRTRVARLTIGSGQDGAVAVDDVLQLGGRVSACAIDGAAVERAVDGCQVAAVDTAHASGQVLRHAGTGVGGRVVLCGGLNGVDGGQIGGQLVHDALHFARAVGGTAVDDTAIEQVIQRRQVGGRDARDAGEVIHVF